MIQGLEVNVYMYLSNGTWLVRMIAEDDFSVSAKHPKLLKAYVKCCESIAEHVAVKRDS